MTASGFSPPHTRLPPFFSPYDEKAFAFLVVAAPPYSALCAAAAATTIKMGRWLSSVTVPMIDTC